MAISVVGGQIVVKDDSSSAVLNNTYHKECSVLLDGVNFFIAGSPSTRATLKAAHPSATEITWPEFCRQLVDGSGYMCNRLPYYR
jgi:hypothetical protein